jgi:hypothetical protein
VCELVIATAFLFVGAVGHSAADRTPPEFKAFDEAVERYLDLRKDVVKKAPKLSEKANPEEIAAHRQHIAHGIRSGRAGARQGDVFVPQIRAYFVETVRSLTKGAPGKTARRTIMKENPKTPGVPGDVKVAVNAPYPAEAPHTTMPPDLLLRLPTLPEGLEYRFVGKALILRDTEAALIVDFLPGALPAEAGS